MSIVDRFEKGVKFLDLSSYQAKVFARDGHIEYETNWECIIWENLDRPDEHQIIEFDSEELARMFIKFNNWELQIL